MSNQALDPKNSRVLQNWDPEDDNFWKTTGSGIAKRNLWVSVYCLVLAFCIWMVFSSVVIKLNHIGFNFTTNQLFWLAALPSISGAILRIPFSFVVPIFGGRRWTTLSTVLLLIPSIWLGLAIQDPHTSFYSFACIAILCGIGGGNFASSMANISFFFPKRLQGYGLGINGGLGDGGIGVVQLCVPLVIGFSLFGSPGGAPQQVDHSTVIWLQNAAFLWIPFILVGCLASWFMMNDIDGMHSSLSSQFVILGKKDTWITSLIYLATFGSFVGFSAGFALLTKTQFPEINIIDYAFVGPLLGAIARPIGGKLSDKFSGYRITQVAFLFMIVLSLLIVPTLPGENGGGSFILFYIVFMGLFIFTNLGSGSSFQLISQIFHQKSAQEAQQQGMQGKRIDQYADVMSSAALGFTSAIGAFGGFIIPKAFGSAISLTHSVLLPLICFAVFYLLCMIVTWLAYGRHH
ncbi:NarK family nitrate/nitrite MFS transporter [Edwardsiella tarda]|uniref:NarK family nitrate/nitrite MFS transporter n=1 Tax=Edwardsiella tarda TaxID=636 RepID=UPI00351CAAC4